MNRWAAPLAWTALLGLAVWPGLLERLLLPLSGDAGISLSAPLWQLTALHLGLVLLSSLIVVALAVPLGIYATRPGNRAFASLLESLTGLGQTVPTLAILALAVPLLGFGLGPTLLGMVLYGLYPVLSGTVAGLGSVPDGVRDAGRGMGMSPWQLLRRAELPPAWPLILAGIRTATVYNVATATIGAALGAGGLGLPIINGLSQQNTALVLCGAIAAALLALSLDAWLAAFNPGQSRAATPRPAAPAAPHPAR